jgi:hypothetical protein
MTNSPYNRLVSRFVSPSVMLSHRIVHCQHDARISQPISQRYSKESQSSSPVDEPCVYRTGVMGSRDPSQSVGP